jgi:hypothetical protein
MSLKTRARALRRALAARRTAKTVAPLLGRLRADGAAALAEAGLAPDPWQADLLRSPAARLLVLCSRQAGKSTAAAALAVRTALLRRGSLTLLLSPTLRQSGELFRDKVLRLWRSLGSPLAARRPTQLTLELANGSRIVSLQENEEGIRGYSGVNLIVIDEAARVADALYYAVRPMLIVSRGTLVALSTPFGKRGWYYEAWTGGGRWERFRASARECPRIGREFLAEEHQELLDRWFRQEYLCSFEDLAGAVFSGDELAAAFAPSGLVPLFPQGRVEEVPVHEDLGDPAIEPLFGSGEF